VLTMRTPWSAVLMPPQIYHRMTLERAGYSGRGWMRGCIPREVLDASVLPALAVVGSGVVIGFSRGAMVAIGVVCCDEMDKDETKISESKSEMDAMGLEDESLGDFFLIS
jgi:hypothetical protein